MNSDLKEIEKYGEEAHKCANAVCVYMSKHDIFATGNVKDEMMWAHILIADNGIKGVPADLKDGVINILIERIESIEKEERKAFFKQLIVPIGLLAAVVLAIIVF